MFLNIPRPSGVRFADMIAASLFLDAPFVTLD